MNWKKEEIEILKKEYPKIEDLKILIKKLKHSERAVVNKAYELKIKRDKGLLRKNQGKSIKKMWEDPSSIYNSKGYRDKLSLNHRDYQTKKTRKKIAKAHKGKSVSEKTKEKLRNLYLGKTYEEIHGEKKAREIKEKLSLLKKGKSYEELYGDKSNSEKEKRRNTHRNLWKDEEYAKKKYKSWRMKPSKPEKIVTTLIKENNLPFDYVGDGKVIIEGFNPDFIFNKKIIEVFGNYWHNLLEIKERDERRLKAYKENDYKTLIIWDYELKDLDEVLNKIKIFIH